MKRIIALVLILLMLLPAASACSGKPANSGTEAPITEPPAGTSAPTQAPTEEPVITAEPTEAPAPTEDPTEAEALRLAVEHGLSADDLRGEYGLFIRFSEAVEGNAALGIYAGFVYRIFPVIADNAGLVDEERLFWCLGRLSIGVGDLSAEGKAGVYDHASDSVLLDGSAMAEDPYRTAPTLFHELMHFVDFTFAGEMLPTYLLDGRRLTPADTALLSPEDFWRKLECIETDFITEGGAELYTAKYFSGAVGSYPKDCAFLTGLEYIYGGDFVQNLFFGPDSDALFAETLLEAGFSEEEYAAACETLNWLSRPYAFDEPGTYLGPEDILIRLYEHRLGGGWEEDKRFIYILRYMDGIALDDYLQSEHAETLSKLLFTSWSAYDRFEAKLMACAPDGASLRIKPPAPFFRGGQLLLGTYADVDGATGALVFEYDFDADGPLGCEFTDTEAFAESFFG